MKTASFLKDCGGLRERKAKKGKKSFLSGGNAAKSVRLEDER